MPANWSSRLSRIDAAADRHLAERLRLVPLAGGRYATAVADPNRASVDVLGRLHVGESIGDLGGEGARTWRTMIGAGRAVAEITLSRMPAQYVVRKDDRLEALDRGRVFIIERVHANEENVLRIELSEASP